MKKILLLTLLVAALPLVGCSSSVPDLKSPCVGASGSPCGDRTPVNDWWLNGEKAPENA